MIEPRSHKEHMETVDDDDDIEKEKKDDEKNYHNNVDEEMKNDDVEKKNNDVNNKKDGENDDNDDHDDHVLIKNTVSGSLETRNEQMQTPIPSPPRSPRTELSSKKTLSEELTPHVSPILDTTSKDPSMTQPTSGTQKVLPGSIAKLSRCQGQLMKQFMDTFITKEYFDDKIKEMSHTLNHLVPQLTVDKTNELMKKSIPRMVNDEIEKDREIFANVVPELVSKEFATHAPNIIEEYKGEATSKTLEERMNIMNKLTTLKKIESFELAQKAKVKWSIAGDENSKYFHGIINKQRNNIAIRGILVDDTWIEDPKVVKNKFHSYFKDRFNIPCASRFTLDMDFPTSCPYNK
ncbi:hypothetical protein Tco_0596480 [Tanacetum coccineum]